MNYRRMFLCLLLCETMLVPGPVRAEWDFVAKYNGETEPDIEDNTGADITARIRNG